MTNPEEERFPPLTTAGANESARSDEPKRGLPWLALGALGVVYGDIGTSPIYALREAFHTHESIGLQAPSVFGVLSLMFWSLIVVISIKYLSIVMRASNNGEGGIIALVALLNPWRTERGSLRHVLMLLGLFGAALLYGDGTITPAISVLSAIEGLGVVAPGLKAYILPLTIAILVGLFLIQRYGTAKVGMLFGPLMLAWFAVLAILGIGGILQHPQVLMAVNPRYAVVLFQDHGFAAFMVMGTVFLVVTGGEALYADMGHFGIRPIRAAWFAIVLPGLLLNYFGQGAVMLVHPQTRQPFYDLAPHWALIPLIALATGATVIASQAVISGVFSLTRQAIQLGQFPRLRIVQTSRQAYGQIYIPLVNWLLMLATIGLVIGFKKSDSLASAYGVAVSMDMVITTILAFFVARRWDWFPRFAAFAAFCLILIDLSFFGANVFKIPDGGWYPLGVAAAIFFLMATWRAGRERVNDHLERESEPLDGFIEGLDSARPRIPGTAVFMTSESHKTPATLSYHWRLNGSLHAQVLVLTVHTRDVPRVPAAERVTIEPLAAGFYRIHLYYGFMQTRHVPVALRLCAEFGLDIDLDRTTFYIGRESLVPSDSAPGMAAWRERVFAFLARNAIPASHDYRIPAERVIEVGIQVHL